MEPLRKKLAADRDTLEQRQRDMERRLLELFEAWDTLQDQSEAPNADSRKKRETLLKEMREILSNRTYVRNIVDDLVATIGEHGVDEARQLIIKLGSMRILLWHA